VQPVCREFRDWAATRNLEVNSLAANRTLADIEALLAGKDEPEVLRNPSARKRRRRLQSEHWQKKRAESIEILDHFEQCLKDRLGERRFWEPGPNADRRRVLFTPGAIFKGHRGRYVIWYCKAEEGRDREVAGIVLRGRWGRVDAYLPYQTDLVLQQAGRRTLKVLQPKATKFSYLPTVCAMLDREGAGMAAALIEYMDEKGGVPLTKFEG
jgi:hypothetical protein